MTEVREEVPERTGGHSRFSGERAWFENLSKNNYYFIKLKPIAFII